jgi:hypothetical protein
MKDRVRNLALATILSTLRVTLSILSRVVPQGRSVVLSVFPETEGNGLEVARALLERYDGRVVWLQDGEPPAEVAALASDGMVLVPKASLRGLREYLRAEAVLFTHGLYGSPRPVGRKPIVNLWHGDGPKDVRPDNGVGGRISSTYLVGSTRLFSGHQAAAFDVPADRVLVTGNPRTDQYWRPVERDRLADLGITGEFVVWMPTFRRTRAVGAMRKQSETSDPEDGTGPAELGVLLEGLRERGLQLVIKPHPMDAEQRLWDGAVTITDDELVRAGVCLYAVLGCSRGLVTDYSSVWVDYLLLDRPLAFLVPDRDSYSRALVPPGVLDWVPGELVGPDQPFQAFLADVDAADRLGAPLRAEAAARIGLNPTWTSAADLLTELETRGVLALGAVRRVGGRAASEASG